jgi:hypothetical protein
MVAAFGSGHYCSVPPDRLLESRPCLNVHTLGTLVEGASVTLQIPGKGCLRATCTAGNLNLKGALILIRWHPSLPMKVFGCPRCGNDRYKLYEVGGIWACRECHPGLEYSCRTFRSIAARSVSRIAWLRRRLGADPRPFTALPAKPPHHRRYWALAREIRGLEERLIEHGQDIAAVLEKRHGRS